MRFARTLLTVATLSTFAVPPAAATAFGVNAHIPRDAVADRIDAAGIEWVRIDFLWLLVEPERDHYDWTIYDQLVDRLEARGLRIYAGLGATPAWATSGPEFSGVPDDPDQWRELCFLAAHRYAGRIHAWALWNEPNLDRFWRGSRQQYLDIILVPGAEALALGDPSALICGPDTAHLSSADWDDWLASAIRAAGDLLDVVTHHVYPSDGRASEVTYDLETGGPFPFSPPAVLEVLEDEGWVGRPFWLTETGIESDRWGETRQAIFVTDLLDEWFAPDRGHRDWVDRVFFYEMADAPSPSAYSFGLLYGPPELVPKAAYGAYSDFIANAEVDDAELVGSDIPVFFVPGVAVEGSVTWRNTGTTSWTDAELTRVAAVIDSSSWTVEADQLAFDEQVEPGAVRTFTVVVTPPGQLAKDIGELPTLSVRLERNGAWWFGDDFRQPAILAGIPPPAVTRQPENRWLVPGAAARIRVEAEGAPPLSYRWYRNAVELTDGDLFTGATTPELTVRALEPGIEGIYHCAVSNIIGGVFSEGAAVAVGLSEPRRGRGRVVPDAAEPTPVSADDLPRFSGPPEPR